MKPFTKALLVLAAGAACLAMPAFATDYPKGGVTGDEIASDLRGIGQKATVGKDSTGDPMIDASFKVGDTDISYKIFFYGCENGRCTSIQYHVAFDGDPSKLAEWNKGHNFARAYVTGDKLIHLEYDVDVEKGANSLAIQNTAQRFVAIMVNGVKTLG